MYLAQAHMSSHGNAHLTKVLRVDQERNSLFIPTHSTPPPPIYAFIICISVPNAVAAGIVQV